MNIERLQRKLAVAFAHGGNLSQSEDLLGREWYDAMARFDEEVDNLAFEGNSERAKSIAKHKAVMPE